MPVVSEHHNSSFPTVLAITTVALHGLRLGLFSILAGGLILSF